MTWSKTWDDILSGGNPRWKVNNMEAKRIALDHISKHVDTTKKEAFEILCPLAGDDQFVHYAWSNGHHVTSIDIVPKAVAAMRDQFGSDWEEEQKPENGMIVWKHKSGRATLYQGDMFTVRNELRGKFDAVYDKDSFGALGKHMRADFCDRLADYTKEGGIVYVEVKRKGDDHPGKDQGPPFSVEKGDLMELGSFGNGFDYVESLGELYPLEIPDMAQTGHVLKRKSSSEL